MPLPFLRVGILSLSMGLRRAGLPEQQRFFPFADSGLRLTRSERTGNGGKQQRFFAALRMTHFRSEWMSANDAMPSFFRQALRGCFLVKILHDPADMERYGVDEWL